MAIPPELRRDAPLFVVVVARGAAEGSETVGVVVMSVAAGLFVVAMPVMVVGRTPVLLVAVETVTVPGVVPV